MRVNCLFVGKMSLTQDEKKGENVLNLWNVLCRNDVGFATKK